MLQASDTMMSSSSTDPPNDAPSNAQHGSSSSQSPVMTSDTDPSRPMPSTAADRRPSVPRLFRAPHDRAKAYAISPAIGPEHTDAHQPPLPSSGSAGRLYTPLGGRLSPGPSRSGSLGSMDLKEKRSGTVPSGLPPQDKDRAAHGEKSRRDGTDIGDRVEVGPTATAAPEIDMKKPVRDIQQHQHHPGQKLQMQASPSEMPSDPIYGNSGSSPRIAPTTAHTTSQLLHSASPTTSHKDAGKEGVRDYETPADLAPNLSEQPSYVNMTWTKKKEATPAAETVSDPVYGNVSSSTKKRHQQGANEMQVGKEGHQTRQQREQEIHEQKTLLKQQLQQELGRQARVADPQASSPRASSSARGSSNSNNTYDTILAPEPTYGNLRGLSIKVTRERKREREREKEGKRKREREEDMFMYIYSVCCMTTSFSKYSLCFPVWCYTFLCSITFPISVAIIF